MDETLVKFSTNLSYAAMLAFVVLSSLNRIGIDTTSFTAVVAAAGLAVGFARCKAPSPTSRPACC